VRDDLRVTDRRPGAVRLSVLGGNAPPLWLLGSSAASAELAAELGLPYAFAHHLNPGEAARATEAHRRSGAATLVSVSVIAAEDDERAEWLAGSTRLKVLSRVRGHRTGELMITTPLYHPEDRRRSYELVAALAAELHPIGEG
jgi:alkanesulfonate monooxygenase SsuD/methylene tetrahydromethanopterin reductase-like flavin-dependent oxidoreductase (luciferase family)